MGVGVDLRGVTVLIVCVIGGSVACLALLLLLLCCYTKCEEKDKLLRHYKPLGQNAKPESALRRDNDTREGASSCDKGSSLSSSVPSAPTPDANGSSCEISDKNIAEIFIHGEADDTANCVPYQVSGKTSSFQRPNTSLECVITSGESANTSRECANTSHECDAACCCEIGEQGRPQSNSSPIPSPGKAATFFLSSESGSYTTTVTESGRYSTPPQ